MNECCLKFTKRYLRRASAFVCRFFTVHMKTNIVYFVGLCSLPKVSAFMHVTNANDAGRIYRKFANSY